MNTYGVKAENEICNVSKAQTDRRQGLGRDEDDGWDMALMKLNSLGFRVQGFLAHSDLHLHASITMSGDPTDEVVCPTPRQTDERIAIGVDLEGPGSRAARIGCRRYLHHVVDLRRVRESCITHTHTQSDQNHICDLAFRCQASAGNKEKKTRNCVTKTSP